jgi:hypothetical protein
MKLIRQLLDYSTPWELPNVYLFTGNGIIKNNGGIVMGRGAALQVRNRYLGVDKAFGSLIAANPTAYVLMHKLVAKQYIGWFKVKNHWQQPADLKLIEKATGILSIIAKDYPIHTYHMNFPGVGNGRLNDAQVMPIIESLPDNVWIYR